MSSGLRTRSADFSRPSPSCLKPNGRIRPRLLLSLAAAGLGVIGIALLLVPGSVLREFNEQPSSSRSTPPPDDSSSSPALNGENPGPQTAKSPPASDPPPREPDARRRPPSLQWSLRKTDGDRYRLTYRIPFEHLDSIPPVNVTIHREHLPLRNLQWTDHPTSGGLIQRSMRIGATGAKLPPGLYRVELQLTESPVTVPTPVLKTSDVIREESSLTYRILSGRAWTYELGAGIGDQRRIDTFRERTVGRLQTRGLALYRSWSRWLETARQLYRAERPDRLDTLYRQLHEGLRAVENASRHILELTGESSWMVHPEKRIRERLVGEAKSMFSKARALSMTVMKQTMGGIPPDWPKKYRVRGFQSNLNVLHHMNQYHQNTIKPLREELKTTKGWRTPYRSRNSYLRHRIRNLMAIVSSVRRLHHSSLHDQFQTYVPDDPERRTFLMKQIRLYFRALLSFHERAVRQTLNAMVPDQSRNLTERLFPLVREVLFCEIQRLGQKARNPAVDAARTRDTPSCPDGKARSRLKSLRQSHSLIPTRE